MVRNLKYRKYIDIKDYSDAGELLDGAIYLFPKLDGINGQIWYDDEIVRCGTSEEVFQISDTNSRKFWEESQDNKYIIFFLKHPHLRLYGEFLVKLKHDYEYNMYDKFFVFDVYNEKTKKYVSYDIYSILLADASIRFIPMIRKITRPTLSELEKAAKEDSKYLIRYKGDQSEGIIIKRYDFQEKDGAYWAKCENELKESNVIRFPVRSSYGEESRKESVIQKPSYECFEDFVVASNLTEDRVTKNVFDILADKKASSWNVAYIPDLLNVSWKNFLSEEIANISERFKNPTINLQKLKRAIVVRVKELKPHLF